jgi:hypothetical protein
MALRFQVMVPRALVVGIATSSRNVQGRVGPALAEMTVVGPTVSIVAGCLHFSQLVVRHEVHAIHGTGLARADGRGDEDGEGGGSNAFMVNGKPENQFGDEHANPYHNGVFDIERRALLVGPGPTAVFDHLERRWCDLSTLKNIRRNKRYVRCYFPSCRKTTDDGGMNKI